MNNNPQNNDNIDDIINILQKKREQGINNNEPVDAPTRIDTQAVKPAPATKPDNATKEESPMKNSTKDNSATSEIKSVSFSSFGTVANEQPKLSKAPIKNEVSQQPKVEQAKKYEPPVKEKVMTTQKKPQASVRTDAISLDDFDEMTKPARKRRNLKDSKDKNFYLPGYVKVIIYLVVVIAISVIISLTIINVSNDMFALVKQDNEITINVPENSSLEEIADILYDNGVINYPFAYKMYTKMKNDDDEISFDDRIISGEHTLNSNMNYDSITSTLLESKFQTSIVRVTIPEGYTVYELLNLLEEKKVINKESRAEMIKLLNDTSAFDYDFLPEMPETITDEDGTTRLDTEKIYLLEGYLFPDTYDFYVGENAASVIRKFLNNFDNKFEEAFYDRCKELKLSVDEVITLASIIQSEGNNSTDFYLISNVFHNRINHPSVLGSTYPVLQSDATSAYAFVGKKKANELTSDEIRNVDSPYNSYKNHGIIPGAICNPGHDAIHAALYPSEYITEVDEKGNSAQIPVAYYYFYTASSNGKTYFSKNLDQHNAFVNADIRKDIDELERLKKSFK